MVLWRFSTAGGLVYHSKLKSRVRFDFLGVAGG